MKQLIVSRIVFALVSVSCSCLVVNTLCSLEAYLVFIEHWNKERIEFNEEFKVMLLNRDKRVLGIATISVGGVNSTVVDPKIVFSIALKANASSIILAHNHPSGTTKPSTSDIAITKKLKSASELLDIILDDHIIVTNDGYFSFADEGLL